MSFKTYDLARKNIVRAGLRAAPVVFALHLCPLSDENPLLPPPEHVEQEAYHPIDISTIECFVSAPSSGGDLTVMVHEDLKINDGAVGVLKME